MKEACIVRALRTPVGKFRGTLSKIRPDDLAGHVIKSVVASAEIDPATIDEVFMGCANQAGEDNRNVARMGTLLAGLPQSVPGVTVNRLCASGLEAVNQAARSIMVGDAEIAVAGGVESMTRAPISMAKPDVAFPVGHQTAFDTTLGWRFPNPKMEKLFPLEAMGITAENLVDEYGISREDQDAFALSSHQKAIAAWDAGHFDGQIAPLEIPQRKKDPIRFDRDETMRADTSLERLARLRPVFKKDGGTVTAGNSSPLSDGAAALILMSRERADALGLEVMASIRAIASAGVNPRTMGIGPVPATRKALARAGMTLADLDLVELNEAFAAQSLAVIRALELDQEKVNVSGGAIALGHPLGCSGAKILATLVHEMIRRDVNVGAASLCVGVGQGVTTIVTR